jgi:predicted alpha/beta-hydrolase family hydrolase
MRLSALLWPFPFGVRLGWASARVPNPDVDHARGRAFLLRGNGVLFSRGFGALCAALRRAGVWAEDLRCVGDRWACRRLIADRRTGRLRGPVILVGHSCGGRYALFAAHRLQAAGVAVDLIVCLDVALPPEVPANVKRALNLYLTRPRL